MTSEAAIKALRSLLRKGAFGPQDKLQPERVLAPLVGCSRSTLRAALPIWKKKE